MALSGTVGSTTFNAAKIIERAFGRCKIKPQLISGEMLSIARDQLTMAINSLPTEGITLWTMKKALIPLYEGKQYAITPLGTIDVYDANLRSSTRVTGTYSSSSGTAANAFDGSFSTSCTQVAVAGNIQVQFSTSTVVDVAGILANSSGTVQYTFQTSDDAVTWSPVYTTQSFAQTAGTWYWFDMDVHNASTYFRVLAGATTTIDFKELYLGNALSEIPMYRFNRNDYMALPNKFTKSRPLQYWFDRRAFDESGSNAGPQFLLWPIPDSNNVYSHIVASLYRQVMDVGSLTNEIEIPQRWYSPVVARLAYYIARESMEVSSETTAFLKSEADSELRIAMSEEIDRGPINIRPSIGAYTR